ncbi:MAG TPA: TetR family transcriptional regulator [Thiotrichales bacterium]|nr:TetR family transcriptional regulator [Thiotrichales bacterium]
MKIPLRVRKQARTRLKLARLLTERLEDQNLEALAVRELCEAAEISEATFFNYFPKKTDLLAYLGRLWTLELQWHAARAAEQAPGLASIHAVFDRAAAQFQASPGAMLEYLALLARRRERSGPLPLDTADRLLAFPDHPGIETLPDRSLETVFAEQLRLAIDRGELPPNTHLNTLMAALATLFHGTILAVGRANPGAVRGLYRQELNLLWAGTRALAGAKQQAIQ